MCAYLNVINLVDESVRVEHRSHNDEVHLSSFVGLHSMHSIETRQQCVGMAHYKLIVVTQDLDKTKAAVMGMEMGMVMVMVMVMVMW